MFCFTCCIMPCMIIAFFGPCIIVLAYRTDFLQRLIFCQMVLNNNATDGNLAWADDNIKCDFDTSTIKGFDDWKLWNSDGDSN